MAQFKRGDSVIAKNDKKHPFWMTVVSVTTNRVYCKLGCSGAYFGAFLFDEVRPYTGETKK